MNKLEAIQQIATHLGVSGQAYNNDGWGKKNFSFRPDDKNPSATFNHISGNIQDHGDKVTTFTELIDKFKIDYTPDDRHEVPSTKRKYDSLKDYAEAHGGDEQWFKDAGWEFSLYSERPCFKYPTATGIRYRFIDNKIDSDGKRLKTYTSTIGYKACFYGLSKAVAMAGKGHHDFIIICNGESSTIIGQRYKLPVFCKTGGENPLPENLLKELHNKWTGTIVIALDNDTKGKGTADKLKVQLPNSIIVDLMQGDHGDLADHCKLHTQDSLKELKRLFSEQNPVKVINSHETDIHVADKVLDALTDEITGKTPIKERAYPFAIASFRKFGGYMRNSKSGKVDIFIGGSGVGKTQLMETMDDKRNNLLKISGNFFTDEWSEKEIMMRRINRYSSPHLTYDQIEDHLMWLGYKQDGISDNDNFGIKFTDAQLATFLKYKAYIQSWTGKTEYFGGEPTLDDTILAMQEAIERRRRNRITVLYTIFDYAQLLRAKGWDNSSNRVEHAFECVKKMSSDLIVHVDMPAQITKNSSKDSKDGKGIRAEDAQFLRSDKANGAFTIDRQYVKDDDGDYLETPLFWLTSRKASLGGAIEGYKYPRVPIMMIPSRLYFETRLDAQHNWTLMREWSHIKGNKFYTGQGSYVNKNLLKIATMPT